MTVDPNETRVSLSPVEQSDTPVSNETPVSPALETAHRWRDMGAPAGMSLRTLGAVIGVSKDTVARDTSDRKDWSFHRGRDGKVYASPGIQRMRAVMILRLRAEGMSIRQIAEESGVNRETVRRAIRDYRLAP